MRSLLVLLAACGSVTPDNVPPAATPAVAAPELSVFPTLRAEDLNGDVQDIPAGLPGRLRLLVVAYERDQQSIADPWMNEALALEQRHPGLRAFTLPVLPQEWAPMKSFVDNAMRRGVRERADRARTLTIFVNRDEFDRSIGVASRDVHTLLVDERGRIVWKRTGQLDESSRAALREQVARRLP